MHTIYDTIIGARNKGQKLLAVLLDPDKLGQEELPETLFRLPLDRVDFVFIGGSTVQDGVTERFVSEARKHTSLPLVLFPGDHGQITSEADAVLFLSLLSGSNPEYLIGQQIKAVPKLREAGLEVLPTGYILVDGGIETAVQRISRTRPLPADDIETIVNTACAGVYAGKRLIYLEAGSGAKNPVSGSVISAVRSSIDVPLIVGGGIRSQQQLLEAYSKGADLVVIGNALEENSNLLHKISKDERIH